MNVTYIVLFNYLVMSVNPENITNHEWNMEKSNWEHTVKRAKAQQLYLQEIATKSKKIIPEYLQTAMKNRDEAKHIYESARELSKPMLKYTGYDIPSFKRAVKHQNEEIVAYKTMLETLQKELTDAENILLEEQGRYYGLKKKQY